jgi:hypothetical protein
MLRKIGHNLNCKFTGSQSVPLIMRTFGRSKEAALQVGIVKNKAFLQEIQDLKIDFG